MNWLYWILEFVGRAAWPVSILILACMFRKPISELIGRVKSASLGESKVEFETQREKLTVSVAQANASVQSGSIIYSASDKAPAKLIDDVWNKIEHKVDELLEIAGLSKNQSTDIEGKIESLRQHEVITSANASSIVGLSHLRNLAVHSPNEDEVERRANEFTVLANAALYALTEAERQFAASKAQKN